MTLTAIAPAGAGAAAPHGAAPAGVLPRLLPAPGEEGSDLAAHLARFGPPPYQHDPPSLVRALESAGLTGRGGAAFPTWRKFGAVAGNTVAGNTVAGNTGAGNTGAGNTGAGRSRPVVVGNGAEGEPASRKDRTLLWLSPHLVCDGLQLAAHAVGAAGCYLYVPRAAPLRQRLQAALDERASAGVDRVPVRLVDAPPRFLAGEASAVANRVAGGPALPGFKRPRVSERGAGDRPTLVQNVETLAHLALIGRYGPGWFRAAGTAEEPGSMLVTCHRADGSSDVVEAEIAAPIGTLLRLEQLPAQAVLVGGYHGTWIPGADAASLRLADAELREFGAARGAGILAALPGDRCGLAESARVARYLALESAGQCGPCLNGLPRIAGALAGLAEPRPQPRALADLDRWSALVDGRGACHHPDGSVRFVRSALAVFAAELTRHQHGNCSGGDAGGGRPFLPVPPDRPGQRSDWR
jgi:NADH:ubiquinone oxidoreductase subunit F (NADH-binding)